MAKKTTKKPAAPKKTVKVKDLKVKGAAKVKGGALLRDKDLPIYR